MTDLLPGPVNRCEAAGGEVKVKYPFVGIEYYKKMSSHALIWHQGAEIESIL